MPRHRSGCPPWRRRYVRPGRNARAAAVGRTVLSGLTRFGGGTPDRATPWSPRNCRPNVRPVTCVYAQTFVQGGRARTSRSVVAARRTAAAVCDDLLGEPSFLASPHSLRYWRISRGV